MTSRASGTVARGADVAVVAAKKRAGEDMFAAEKKRKQVKKPAFIPQPVAQPSSGDTPPENDALLHDFPPPPSERKIARRRPSMRAARQPSPDSPPVASKRQKLGSSQSLSQAPGANDPLRADLLAFAPAPMLALGQSTSSTFRPMRIDFGDLGTSKTVSKVRRVASPPRHIGIGANAGRPSMGPPSEPFVRKTRKSMGLGLGIGDLSEFGMGMGMGVGVGAGGSTSGIGDRIVPIPDNETPMIRKNRALREDQSRRSSQGLRGQRASNSMGKGDLSIPHRSVDSTDFYKHISATMPEPHRARHLLVYCSKRAYDVDVEEAAKREKRGKSKSRDKEPTRTEEGDRIVREVMDAFLAGLGKGEVETNVFDSNAPKGALALAPHPKNELNRKLTEKSEAIIRASKAENSAWTSIKVRFNRHQKETFTNLQKRAQVMAKSEKPDMTGADEWIVQALNVADGLIKEGAGELEGIGEFEDVEYKVDLLNQTTHTALQYCIQATRFLDGIFSSLSRDLQYNPSSSTPIPTDGDGPDPVALLSAAVSSASASASGSGGAKANAKAKAKSTDPINMLRALAAADSRSGNTEAVERANNVAPVSAAAIAAAAATAGGGGGGGGLGASVGPGAAAGGAGGGGGGAAALAATPRRSAPTPRARGQSMAGPGAGPGAGAGQGTGGPGTGGVRGRLYGRGTQAGAD